jgi:hypothetical protein
MFRLQPAFDSINNLKWSTYFRHDRNQKNINKKKILIIVSSTLKLSSSRDKLKNEFSWKILKLES